MNDDWYYRPRPEDENQPPSDLPGEDADGTRAGSQYDDLDDLIKSFTPPTPPPEGERRHRARERVQARQTRTMAVPKVAGAGADSAPKTGGRRITLPRMSKLRLPINRVGLYVVGSVIFVIAIVLVLGRIRNNPVLAFPNAIWIGTEWTYESHMNEEVIALSTRFREHEIGTVYAWTSWLQADGTWRGTDNFPRVQEFVRQLDAAYPEAVLLGWISLPVEGAGIPYRLDSVDVQTQIAEFAGRVVEEFGFDGVFLNVEPVWNEDDNFLALLRAVRSRLGADVPISVAVPPDWSPVGVDVPVPPQIIPGTVWSTEYKQSVALLADELAVMAYNSGLSTPEDYKLWVAYQVEAFGSAVAALGVTTDVIIGIPTYDAEPPGHDPQVENVASASEGIAAGLTQLGDDAVYVRGTALYAGWTTDELEWLDYLRAWVNR